MADSPPSKGAHSVKETSEGTTHSPSAASIKEGSRTGSAGSLASKSLHSSTKTGESKTHSHCTASKGSLEGAFAPSSPGSELHHLEISGSATQDPEALPSESAMVGPKQSQPEYGSQVLPRSSGSPHTFARDSEEIEGTAEDPKEPDPIPFVSNRETRLNSLVSALAKISETVQLREVIYETMAKVPVKFPRSTRSWHEKTTRENERFYTLDYEISAKGPTAAEEQFREWESEVEKLRLSTMSRLELKEAQGEEDDEKEIIPGYLKEGWDWPTRPDEGRDPGVEEVDPVDATRPNPETQNLSQLYAKDCTK